MRCRPKARGREPHIWSLRKPRGIGVERKHLKRWERCSEALRAPAAWFSILPPALFHFLPSAISDGDILSTLNASAQVTTKVTPSVNNTFGYDIMVYGRPLVHQSSTPGLPGNEGFRTKEAAQRVADFVAKKIRNNEMPPTVSIEELNGMGVLK
jgi:hypothetical protein